MLKKVILAGVLAGASYVAAITGAAAAPVLPSEALTQPTMVETVRMVRSHYRRTTRGRRYIHSYRRRR